MKTEEQIRNKIEEYENKINASQRNGDSGKDDSTEFIAGSLYIMIYLERVRILKWVLNVLEDEDKV